MFAEIAAAHWQEPSFWPSIARQCPGRTCAPSILAIGDSWFFYPMPGGSLINGLRKAVARKKHTIHAVGDNGASLHDLVYGKYRAAVDRVLESHGPHLSAVLVSGGGNDLADGTVLRPMLHQHCGRARLAIDCFRPGNGPGTLGGLLLRLTETYDALINRIVAATPRDTPIVVHDYDNALPSGRSAFLGMTAWFKPAFDFAGVPLELQASCVVHVLDHFTAALERIVAQRAGQVALVRSRGTLSSNDWANELHPTGAGFQRLAHDAWGPVLRGIGIA